MTDDALSETPAARLPRVLKSCWKQGCADLSALLGQPLKFRSESIARVPAAGLEAALDGVGVFARLNAEGEAPVEFRLAFTTPLALILSGVLNVQRPEEIQARTAAGAIEADDLNALGQLAHILASAFDEALRLDLAGPLHVTCHEIQAAASAEAGMRGLPAAEVVLQRLTLAVAGMGEGVAYFYFPAEFGELLAGGAWDVEPEESVAPVAAPARPPGRAIRGNRPARRAVVEDGFEGADGVTPRVLVAGPVPQDVADMEEALLVQGIQVERCDRLRDIGVLVDPLDFTLLVLVVPPGSLAALPLLRDLAALETAPPVVLATRRPTPSIVFQAARAGAAYVVVLPPDEGAMIRVTELAAQGRRAAA